MPRASGQVARLWAVLQHGPSALMLPRKECKSVIRGLFVWAALMVGSLLHGTVASYADQTGEFDFYVLALSWSPTYCEQEGADANRHQCDVRDPFRFVVHGLWPQYENGYPESCPGVPTRIDREIAVGMEDIMPSHGLVFHQWRKHGTCSGLEADDYFELTRKAYEKVRVPKAFRTINKRSKAAPKAVEKAFLAINSGMKENGIAVLCDRGDLDEVRICLTKDLQFRTCPAVDRSDCRSKSVTVPAPVSR